MNDITTTNKAQIILPEKKQATAIPKIAEALAPLLVLVIKISTEKLTLLYVHTSEEGRKYDGRKVVYH